MTVIAGNSMGTDAGGANLPVTGDYPIIVIPVRDGFADIDFGALGRTFQNAPYIGVVPGLPFVTLPPDRPIQYTFDVQYLNASI